VSSDDHDHHHGEGHDHDHDRARRRRRGKDRDHGSVGGWITNWNEYDASTGTKLALAARNLLIGRWKKALLCCGHPGQPGC
jgi:hypothetical protein